MNPRKRKAWHKVLAGAAVLAGSVLMSSCCQPVISGQTSKTVCEYVGPLAFLEEAADENTTTSLVDLPEPQAATTASSSCPDVNFLQGGILPLASTSFVAGLQRQADGSFTGWEYDDFAPFSFVKSSPVIFNCSASGAPTFQNSAGWTPLEDHLGATSQPVLFANLLGNGTPVGLAIVPAGFMSGGTFVGQPSTTSLMVAIPNASGTAKSFTFYSVPSGAQSILTGDFNNDGKLDVVVIADSNSNGIAVYLGNGDGTLQSPNFFSGDQATIQAVAYDFNGDGNLDLAVLNGLSNDVSILLGNGHGTFATAVNYPASVTGAGQIVAGDFNGDGHEDVAVSGASSISVLLNKGGGTFGAAINTPGAFNYITGLAAGDFNNDGKLDVALTDSGGGTVSIFLGNGAGMFPTEYDYVAGSEPTGLFAMDLDGDGNLDVVIASGHPDMLIPNENAQFITVFYGLGNGTLIGPPAYHAGSSPNAIAIADFNGDGTPDVVSAAGQLWIGIAGQPPFFINLPSGVSASGVAAADFNGDGKPDIVVGDANGSGVYVLLGNGDGTFKTPVPYSTGGGAVNSIAIADFNGDGKPDIAFCGFANLLPPVGAAGILFGNGGGTFQAATSLGGFGSSPGALAVADFNSDGKPDLAIVDQGYRSLTGGVNVYLNPGNGIFQTPVSYTVGQYPVFIAAAEVGGGKAADLIVSTQDPNYNTNGQWDVAVLLGNGNGTFMAPSYLPTQTNPTAIAIGDLNGDRNPDLAIGHSGSGASLTYMLGNGNGTFQAEAAVPTAVAATALAAANLTGNGVADLIAGTGLRVGYVSYFLNLMGLSTATTPVSIQTNPTGLEFSVDGGAAQTAPQTLNLTQGTHTIAVMTTQGTAGTQDVFTSWSDGGAASHSITVGTTAATYTATFTVQYLLTTAVSPAGAGSITPSPASSSGYYNAGASVQLTATPNAGYEFTNWTGGLSGGTNPQSIAMSAPESVTANFVVSSCVFVLSPASVSLPATGTSTVETCPNNSGQPACGVYPETPRSFTVTPTGTCGAWTATSSVPGFLQVLSGASGSGSGAVTYAQLTNTHNGQQNNTITVASVAGAATFTATLAGNADNQTYREIYALYEQFLGRDPDSGGFAFWSGVGGAGLGQMADDFLTSPEFFNSGFAVMAAYQAATGAPPTYAQYTAAVASVRAGAQTVPGLFGSLIGSGFTSSTLYQNLLNRAPGTADSGCVSSGLTQCLQTIIGYPATTTPVSAPNNEFQSTGSYHTTLAADHTNGLYVQMIYFVTLDRDPDPSGLAFWLGIANMGGPGLLFQGAPGYFYRDQILGPGTPNQGFIGSPEFQGLFAN